MSISQILRKVRSCRRSFMSHDHMCSLLAASEDTQLQLAEALLYCSLVPSLVPGLEDLHTLLVAKEALNNDTALFAGKCLSNLRYDDWRALNISEVLPSLNLLASSLVDERPEDVSKFYTCLPEVEGLQVYKICVSKVHPPLQVPVLPSFPSSSEKLWVGKCVEAEK